MGGLTLTPLIMIDFNFNDGGREAAGKKGSTGDCVTRAVAIASGLPYLEVYNRLAEGNAKQRILSEAINAKPV